ncbi:hypothetical protein Aple_058420 [Acrocarpospora pleiomorpha]|uniref:Uncharacterized protein n=1 Tax=Acrocarpospora pleiomorpha TaxID=90975 RepID=A0A5M3XUE6_9ACTN|nr:hypothetical protein Aple_058420 [Acrocarpospora pleiomorpha]
MRRASDNRSSTSMPTPSDQLVPSAVSENALDRPSGAIPPCALKPTKTMGDVITVTPPASARLHSPDRSACAAMCIETRDDEQAVSTVTAGPSNPSVYERRPDNTLAARPVTPWPWRSA